MTQKALKELLDSHVAHYIDRHAPSLDNPDPIMIAKEHNEEYAALVCALFAYGNVHAIVKFLNRLPFEMLKKSVPFNSEAFKGLYYRFQTQKDIQMLFYVLKSLKTQTSLETIFMQGYSKNCSVLEGVHAIIHAIYAQTSYRSRGFEFLVGTISKSSTYKRWLMYLRWMVRKDAIDLGLWHKVNRAHLLLPLDVHTFKMGQKYKLITRKTYDQKAVIEATNSLKKLNKDDPIQYDFALYRLGQTGELSL